VTDDPEYDIDFRANPDEYDIGRGEEGVFKVEPYKSELLDHWGFADRETADEAGEAIHEKYREYRESDDFPGMDMARKYLQMGYTRAMRYARYPGGQKYEEREARSASDSERAKPASEGKERDPEFWADGDKREAALIYEVWWEMVEDDERYRELRERHG
jgi:hypothetical protein